MKEDCFQILNESKFCFIICSNNNLLLEEALHYINHLIIPVGFSIEVLIIENAKSMTAGYNEAMASSDARYKIYMHQDVFILNKYFLSDLLSIFQSDSQIGLIGMIGYDTVSSDGYMWHEKCLGNYYQRTPLIPYPPLTDYHYSLSNDGYHLAAEVDGFLMATSQDYSWNTQDLTGFDFYDAYQSLTFLLHGHKIAVPVQRYPWCMHDDGMVLDMTNYDRYRHAFMCTYKDYLGKHYSEILGSSC